MPIIVKTFIVSALFAAICASCAGTREQDPRGLTTLVSIEGSNTMASLMQSLSREFMATHPNIPVSLTTDDSGTGIAALINRNTDLAAASRDLNDAELKMLRKNGMNVRKVTVAGDALVIFVNPANAVSEMTIDQIRDVFSGVKKNWSDVGGANKPIRVLGRSKDSGSYAYIREHVLKGAPYAETVQVLPSPEALTAAVEKDVNAIAYEGLANAKLAGDRIKLLKVKITETGPAVMPDTASVLKNYPLSRPLILFSDSSPKKSVQDFIDFCTSETGQKVITGAGYARLK